MAGATDHAPLTPRQHQVLFLIAQGMNGPAVARKLNVSPDTVSDHVARIRQRLNVRTIAQAAFMLGLGDTITISDQWRDTNPPASTPAARTQPAKVTDPHSRLYLKAMDRWVNSGFADQTARDLMNAIHGRRGNKVSRDGDPDIRNLLEAAAGDTLPPTRR